MEELKLNEADAIAIGGVKYRTLPINPGTRLRGPCTLWFWHAPAKAPTFNDEPRGHTSALPQSGQGPLALKSSQFVDFHDKTVITVSPGPS